MACDCAEASTCRAHEQRERANRLHSFWLRVRNRRALETAERLVAAEPLSPAEIKEQKALDRFPPEIGDWAYTSACEIQGFRWTKAFPSEVRP